MKKLARGVFALALLLTVAGSLVSASAEGRHHHRHHHRHHRGR